ncbi:deoxyuridine 5'-triphosphate nucleotidohydrolase-like [Xenia sp. Carnegie-2017]|uniref:deoxyuridine 5'-triphosphate nucleotidohydrolase-like n=1 Tax=Xenia sp. Carnegie-2017 TaxID=2897299 RepID=UPI001F03E734|nr:deoxyuridine 5'-triphosphate nucleotidohydrolase-like [Xenia sp. Carnegie-2017]
MGQLMTSTIKTIYNTLYSCKESLPKSVMFSKMSENAMTPTRGSCGAAGYDLYAAYDAQIPAQGKALVKTDIAVALPEGWYGRVAPRSGLSWKHHLDVGAGVIDSDYRGNVGVILFNLSHSDYEVKGGDRIAQLIIQRICTPELKEVKNLDQTIRGDGGYGSTGRN